MNKRILTIVIILSMLMMSLPLNVFSASNATAYAAYGTPVIDGKIDAVWNNTNYYTVTHCNQTGEDLYKGWFKVLWDENYIYVLAKSYSVQLDDSISYGWMQDSFDVYIDENMARTVGYEEDDYQVRTNYKSLVSGSNYPDFSKVKAGATEFETGFIGEMAIPLLTKTPKDGLTVGFEVLMTASATPAVEVREYLWNCDDGWKYNNTSCYGNLVLKKSVDITEFNEPEWVKPKSGIVFNPVESYGTGVKYVEGVTTYFDSTVHNYPILHVEEYPSMEINNLAAVIGGAVENGDTLCKDDVKIKYTAGSRLAEYGNGHLMLEREAVIYEGKLYVPVSSVVPTLIYTMHYDRFNKYLEIKTGTDYPDTEVVVYAKDYGAVGDGVHDDGKAITKAMNAAINSGKPSKLVLEPGKTYLIGSRADNLNYFLLEDVENFIFDGQGSMLLFETTSNSFIDIRRCTNVKIMNLEVDYKELPFTQGTATEINNNSFVIEIEEGFPLPASDEWVKHYWKSTVNGGWWFTQIMDPVEPRFKYTNNYEIFINSIDHIEGRKYLVKVKGGYEDELSQANVGDRFVLNTRYSAYDVGDWTHSAWLQGMVEITESGDITLDTVNIYQSPWHCINVGNNWGRVKLINWGMIAKEGRLMSANSDGIHYWRSRGGIVLDNCVMMNNLDDQINTKGESATIKAIIDDYTYDIGHDPNMRVGDEMLFMNQNTHSVIGKAFLKSWEKINASTWRIVVDRKVNGVLSTATAGSLLPSVVFDNNAIAEGSVIKNSKFMYSRRYAWLTKSKNSLFDNNVIYENGGSAISASDELRPGGWEGPFPSSFTMRNNIITAPNQMPPDYPAQVGTNNGTKNGETANIEGFLIENNTIESGVNATVININSVDGLYMLNNKIVSDEPELKSKTATPIVIKNSRIEEIDGIDFNFKQNVDNVITFVGCEFNEADIKNININPENTASPYDIN